MGTVHVLEAVRRTPSVRVVVVVTSDKCYGDREPPRPHRETDPLGGHDPYASSKAAAELVTAAYRASFFLAAGPGAQPVAAASARAGNVIGGGDWSKDRLVPDIMAALIAGRPVALRNAEAVRPWQHVLEALAGYLLLAEQLGSGGAAYADAWNFGPEADSDRSVRVLTERLADLWGAASPWTRDPGAHPHESRYLRLDAAKARVKLGWAPKLSFDDTLRWIVEWYRGLAPGDPSPARRVTLDQIARYEAIPPPARRRAAPAG
jgi:CDP-glucose 4,6-dehydratase